MFVCVSVVLMEFQKLAQPCKSSQDKKKSHIFFQIPDVHDFGATESLHSLKLDSRIFPEIFMIGKGNERMRLLTSYEFKKGLAKIFRENKVCQRVYSYR